MTNVAVYAYAQPYRKRYINILEVVILVDVLLLLMILSTKVIDKLCLCNTVNYSHCIFRSW